MKRIAQTMAENGGLVPGLVTDDFEFTVEAHPSSHPVAGQAHPASVLTENGHVGHGYILNGPETLTARAQIEILSDVLGRTIDFVEVTPEQVAQDSIEHGTPVHLAEAMQNLNELFRAGGPA
jgi:hypothetical protein